jgi:uncharacterized membrane protein YccC
VATEVAARRLNQPVGSRYTWRQLPAWAINGLTVFLGLLLVQGSMLLMAGAHAAQTAIATAVCASLADVVTTTDRVARRVCAAIFSSTASAAIFLATRPHASMTIPVVMLIVLLAMLIQSWGPKAVTVSFATTMALVFAMSVPASQKLTSVYLAWGLVGSVGYWIWAVITAKLLQPTWRRISLANTVADMAHLLRALSAQARHPEDASLQAQVVRQEAALAERMQSARDLIFGNADGPTAHLQTSVLLRLSDLRDLAIAGKIDAALVRHGPPSDRERVLVADVLRRMATAVERVADHIRTEAWGPEDAASEAGIRHMLDELERPASDGREGARGILAELLRTQFTHVQSIRAMHEVSSQPQVPCQRSDLRRYIVPDEWRLAAVWKNLRTDSPTFRYAVRTALAAGFAFSISRLLPWTAHPQWVLLSVIVVMQGSLAQTLVRRNARVFGTLAGCVVVAGLTFSPSATFLSLCFLLAAGVAHAYLGVRYSVTAAAAAVMAVLQAHLVAHGADFSIVERLGDTVIGALVGWGASYALPSWERRRVSGDLREAAEAVRQYAAEALRPDDGTPGLPRFARQRAYDAIRAVEASQARTLVEPSSVRLPLTELTRWLTASYDLMSHLSNARLSMTLYAGPRGDEALATGVAAFALSIDEALAGSQSAHPPSLDHEVRAALQSIPNLLPRLLDAAADVGRVCTASRQLLALIDRT